MRPTPFFTDSSRRMRRSSAEELVPSTNVSTTPPSTIRFTHTSINLVAAATWISEAIPS